MLSTVTYALSKKYADKAVEKAADVAVDKAVDAAKEAVAQNMSEFSGRLDSLEEGVDHAFDEVAQVMWKDDDYLNTSVAYFSSRVKGLEDIKQYIDEEQDPSNEWDGKKYTFRNDVLTRIDAENYKCKMYRNLLFYNKDKNEWVFDVYCRNKNEPVAILCPNGTGDGSTPSFDACKVIYADKAGPVDKTILLSRLVTEYPDFGSCREGAGAFCTIILNSYQSEPILYKHKFDNINVYTKAETDAAIGTVSQDVDECSDRIDTLEKDMFIIDKERDASNSWSGQKYVFSNNVLTQVADGDYQCKMYLGLNITNDEWVFDAYCGDVNTPVAILCPNGTGDSLDDCKPIYAKKVGPVDKTIFITKEDTGYPSDACIIIVNSYQSEPTLYQHRLDVYTREGTDAAIANAINSAITNVINTAY